MKKDIKALLGQVEQKLVKRMHEKPSKATLDNLALFVGFQDWESFQHKLHEAPEDDEDVVDLVTENKEKKVSSEPTEPTQISPKKRTPKIHISIPRRKTNNNKKGDV